MHYLQRTGDVDAPDQLDNGEVIAAYLTVALEVENSDVFLAAVADFARTRGMTVRP